MQKETIKNLAIQLHDEYGKDLTSPPQQQLMLDLQNHIHNLDEPAPKDPSFQETLALLIAEVEEEHPKAASVAREIISALGKMGI